MDSSRPTDLDELDMHALVAASALAFDKQDSEFSGWIHVADATPAASAMPKTRRTQQRLVFRKRFCRLRELICTFHESDAPAHVANPVARHVVIAVERVHERNKAFALTDYDDRRVLLHTTLGADFEEWFAAFATAVRKTQVSKARAANAAQDERASDRSSDAASIDDELSDERTYAAWLTLHMPWWKLRRRRARQYCVLSGTTLSCFSVNKEGHLADLTQQLTALQYDAVRNPFVVTVRCASGKTLRLSRSTQPEIVQNWVARLQIALAAQSHRRADTA